MKRSGFTMIELIFVIVILGILAAVALPKFIGVSEQAQESKLKAFVGTLNRTVAPALWSKAISDTTLSGSIQTLQNDFDAQIETPTDLGDTGHKLAAPTVATCEDWAGAAATTGYTDAEMLAWATVATLQMNGVTYNVRCMDGSMTAAPRFVLEKDGETVPLVK